jgi:SAM-dependent methyltransferase
MLLNRLPSDRELAEGQAKGIADLLATVVSQRDYLRTLLFAYFAADADGRHGRATQAFYDFVGEIGAERLQALRERMLAIPRKIQNGHDYAAFHCRRMVELMGFLERWRRDHPVTSLLDIGNSPFFALYPELFPGIQAYLVDLYPPPPEHMTMIGAQAAYKVDLNRGCISQAAGGPVALTFDVIIFTEVIEHLFIAPAEALRDLIALLNPGGIIYFSTPNYLKARSIERMLDRGNPQQTYSRADGANQGSHYHLREYTFYELRDAVAEAGGELVHYAFSDCWDRSDYSEEMQEEIPIPIRSNLVLIIRKAEQHAANGDSAEIPVSGKQAELSGTAARAVVYAFTSDLDQVVDVDVNQPVVNLDRLSFDEQWYLKMNRDVAEAVREGLLESGWDHYVNYGKQEGRQIRRRLVWVRESK